MTDPVDTDARPFLAQLKDDARRIAVTVDTDALIPPRCDSTLTGVGYVYKCALEFGHAELHRAMNGKEWAA